MTVLDQITQMQQKGMSTTEISRQLQAEGITPAQINEAINQASIKQAVTEEAASMTQAPTENLAPEGMQATSEVPSMQSQDIMAQNENMAPQSTPEGMVPTQDFPAPAPEDYGMQPATYDPAQSTEDYYAQTPQSYTGQEYYPPTQGFDTETISEIAEQVVIEKFSEFTKRTGDLVSFKNNMEDKVADLSERLKRIENTIDKLQNAIIGRIGEFGESTAAIHQDLDNLHGTVSKLMNPLVDNLHELKKLAGDDKK